MIYLASPYSHWCFLVRWWRWFVVSWVVARLMRRGVHVFSPIANTHWIAVFFRLPGDFNFWCEYNEDMIKRCDRFVVLRIRGWRESVGCIGEACMAVRNDVPVMTMDPRTLEETKVSRETTPRLNRVRNLP